MALKQFTLGSNVLTDNYIGQLKLFLDNVTVA